MPPHLGTNSAFIHPPSSLPLASIPLCSADFSRPHSTASQLHSLTHRLTPLSYYALPPGFPTHIPPLHAPPPIYVSLLYKFSSHTDRQSGPQAPPTLPPGPQLHQSLTRNFIVTPPLISQIFLGHLHNPASNSTHIPALDSVLHAHPARHRDPRPSPVPELHPLGLRHLSTALTLPGPAPSVGTPPRPRSGLAAPWPAPRRLAPAGPAEPEVVSVDAASRGGSKLWGR